MELIGEQKTPTYIEKSLSLIFKMHNISMKLKYKLLVTPIILLEKINYKP